MTNQRIARLREKMDGAKLDAFWVTAPSEANDRQLSANRRYMSGFTGSLGNLLITRDDAFIAVDFRYWEQAEREARQRSPECRAAMGEEDASPSQPVVLDSPFRPIPAG